MYNTGTQTRGTRNDLIILGNLKSNNNNLIVDNESKCVLYVIIIYTNLLLYNTVSFVFVVFKIIFDKHACWEFRANNT